MPLYLPALLLLLLSATSAHAAPSYIDKTSGRIVYGPKADLNASALKTCDWHPPTWFDQAAILRRLYGPVFDIRRPAAGQVLVLGQHNSGTSVLTRLMMMMGLFQGNLDGLSTSPRNRLKYWEKLDVSHFHDMVLQLVTNPDFKPYQAQDVNFTRITPEVEKVLRCFIRKVIRDLDRHPPWVLKDPRMLLFTHYWLEQMVRPVCVVVFREPISNAVSLHENHKKNVVYGSTEMTISRWLAAWEQGMLSALTACRDTPTVLVSEVDMHGDLERFLFKLYAELGQAGVYGMQLPSQALLESEYLAHVKQSRSSSEEVTSQNARKLTLSQSALYTALHLVASSPDNGIAMDIYRADAVLRFYADTMRTQA